MEEIERHIKTFGASDSLEPGFLKALSDDIKDIQREKSCCPKDALDCLVAEESDQRMKDVLVTAGAMAITLMEAGYVQ
jgi:hypothetical protein